MMAKDWPTMEMYPAGCGGCEGACCKDVGWGRPPWTEDELRLSEMTKRFDGDEFRARLEIRAKMERLGGECHQVRECINRGEDGRCSLEVIFDEDAKPAECQAMGVRSEKCLEARRRWKLPA